VGKLLMPLLGTPVLETGSSPAALIVIALSAAVAACGYGILIGTMARTYEQASSFGAVSVVIAAAIGGIMVPVFVMPAVMQKISIFSPLSWGLSAFMDVFVRGGSLRSVLFDVALLVLFFLVTTLVAWFNLSLKGRIRIQ
jgi:ABC-2 type transport system permease protein